MGLLFFPRGGSAQVARYLARSLPDAGWEATIACGSLGAPGRPSHAETFYAGLDVRALDYSPAASAPDPLTADPPFQPSYEDRPDAPDRVFARVDDDAYERLVATWERQLAEAGAAEADVLHLHHLTPINEAAERAFPDVPRVGHLHGTELLMLREIEEGPPPGWDHAGAWADRMRRWAGSCQRLFVLSPDAVRRVPDLLGVEPERVVWAPNGFDPEGFDRRPVTGEARVEHWRRWLAEDPQGWDESGEPGSVAYSEDDLDAFREGGPVLLYVGRFTEVKRIPLLIRAYARARERFSRRAPLVLLGGFPGEWEGDHPLEVVREAGDPDVFLAGWRGHEDLPDGLNAADVVVLPSVREQFGAVLVEGMACGLPPIAVDAHGPAEIVDDGETGWLVPPDDEDAMGEALAAAVNDEAERSRRGEAAYEVARGRYSWPALARGVAHIYDDVRAGRPAGGTDAHRGGIGPPASLSSPRVTSVPYTIRRSERARYARIHVEPHGVEVVVPRRFPLRDVEPFVEEKRRWIERTLRRMRESELEQPPARLEDGGEAPYLGERLALRVRVEPGRVRPHVARRAEVLHAAVALPGPEPLRDALERWYRRRAREEIVPRLDSAVRRAGASYVSLQIRGQRTRWASCSSSGSMSFNWRLLLAPAEILYYVVEHEVAHLEVPDHSDDFWDLLASRVPDWERHERWLRKHGHALRL
jgi:predicted metal-dependent hydrolase/glycosyltransferase involved in cell wall biosynthesis